MLLLQYIRELLSSLESIKPPKELSVVVMPDFYLDRFVYGGDVDIKDLCKTFIEVASRKGGGIHGIKQAELRGGNAANTAAALATLGIKVYPIILTSPLGLHMLKYYLGSFGADLSHVKTYGEMSLTVAFEVAHKKEKVNVMLGYVGSLTNFGLDDLTPEDFQLLEKADYVCVFNWSGMKRWGTELAEGVFNHVKAEGRGKTYFDTADPSTKKKEVPTLIRKVLLRDLVDTLSINEFEAFYYASQLNENVRSLEKTLEPEELSKECARILANNISARIDLHTTTFVGSFTRKSEIIVPAFKVPVLRATGAGDAWNAGNIFGDALGFSHSCRLTLANAVAAYYISNPTGEHPTLSKLKQFCLNQLEQLKTKD